MSANVIGVFGGLAPRKSPELLSLQGQVAMNCRLLSGKLQAWATPVNVGTCPSGVSALYRLDGPNASTWLSWSNAVSVAPSVIPGDEFGRLFITGNGEPQATDYALAAYGATNLLTTDYKDHQGAYTWFNGTLASLSLSVGQTINFSVQVFSELTGANAQVVFLNSSGGTISTVNGNTVTGSNFAYSIVSAEIPTNTTSIELLTSSADTNAHSRIAYLTVGTPASCPASAFTLGVPAPASALTATPSPDSSSSPNGSVTELAQSKFQASSSSVVETPATGEGNFAVTVEQTITAPFGYTASMTGSYTTQMAKANASSGEVISGTVQAILYVDGTNVWSDTETYYGSASGSSYTYNYSYDGDSQLAGSHDYKLVITTPTSGNLLVNSATGSFAVQFNQVTALSVTNGSNLEQGSTITISGCNSSLNGTQTVVDTATNGSDTWILLQLDSTNASATNLSGTWAEAWAATDMEDTSYIMTYLLDFDGQLLESAPSPASAIVARGQDEPTVLTNIPALPDVPSGTAITGMNLYRTVMGSQGTAYQFVKTYDSTTTPTLSEFVASGDTDSAVDSALGEVIPTLGWIPPPVDLQGIVATPNGFFAGFVANTVWLSVPYQPQAWPVAQSYSVDSTIVGIVPVGQSLAVLTTGKPYLLTGYDPAAMSMQRVEVPQGCVSARSVVDMGYGALYASDDGIVMISTKGPQLVTQALWTKDEFALLNPSSFIAGRYHDSYICFYDANGTQGGFVFDPTEPVATLSMIDIYASACWTDPATGELYLAVGTDIQQWNAGDTAMSFTWQSQDEVMHAPDNLGAAFVRASGYPVTFTLYADGNAQTPVTVNSDEIFRLPAGFRYRRYSVAVSGSDEVLEMGVATSTPELVQAKQISKERDSQMKHMLADYRIYT